MKVQNTQNAGSAAVTTDYIATSNVANTAKSAAPLAVKESKQPDPEALKASVDKINQDLKQNKVNLDFSIDKASKEFVVKVIDSSTGDVLTQFPSKQALAISELIANKQKGVLLNDKA